MTTEDACAGCLVATALCPVAALCGPCLCCAANVVAWHDEKIVWFRNVDGCCQHVIVDQHETEVVHDVRWICTCGHIYDASLDGYRVQFRDLPCDWPCPSCGQTRLDQWIPGAASADIMRLEHVWDTPRHDVRQLGSHRLIFDTCTTHLSSAASVGLCSGTFSTTDHSSETSWQEGCTSEDEDIVDETNSVLPCSDWYCEVGHALAWNGEQMWCKVCNMSVSWPIWHETAAGTVAAQRTSQQHTLTWHTPAVSDCLTSRRLLPGEMALAPCHESRSLRLIDGEVYRKGLGGQNDLLTRPGFQAGGGTSGPWWTATDAKFLGR